MRFACGQGTVTVMLLSSAQLEIDPLAAGAISDATDVLTDVGIDVALGFLPSPLMADRSTIVALAAQLFERVAANDPNSTRGFVAEELARITGARLRISSESAEQRSLNAAAASLAADTALELDEAGVVALAKVLLVVSALIAKVSGAKRLGDPCRWCAGIGPAAPTGW